MGEPARTFEEFLCSQNLDDWPRFPYIPDMDVHPVIAKLRNDYSLNTITKYLYDNAPLPTEILCNLEKKVDECEAKVHEHAQKVLGESSTQEEIDEQFISPPEQAGDASTNIVIKTKKKVKIATDITQDASCKTVEKYKFPGFSWQQLTNLPSHLEPAQLWDLILKIQTFQGGNLKVLKKLFLSEASLAILQDCFWWWFLQKFKPDQEQQDHLFDRISTSFVVLLLSTPNYVKDPFFQMYPDCLSQAIYVTFCEAFPESSSRFDDEFKDGLMDLIFQWIRGFRPQKFAWKSWNLCMLDIPTKQSMKKDSILQSSLIMKPEMSRLKARSMGAPLRLQMTPSEEKLPCEIVQPKKESTPVSPTYEDIIDKSKKRLSQRRVHFLDLEHKYGEELWELEQQRRSTDKKFRRMLARINKSSPESRWKTENFLNQLVNATPCTSASNGASLSVKDMNEPQQ